MEIPNQFIKENRILHQETRDHAIDKFLREQRHPLPRPPFIPSLLSTLPPPHPPQQFPSQKGSHIWNQQRLARGRINRAQEFLNRTSTANNIPRRNDTWMKQSTTSTSLRSYRIPRLNRTSTPVPVSPFAQSTGPHSNKHNPNPWSPTEKTEGLLHNFHQYCHQQEYEHDTSEAQRQQHQQQWDATNNTQEEHPANEINDNTTNSVQQKTTDPEPHRPLINPEQSSTILTPSSSLEPESEDDDDTDQILASYIPFNQCNRNKNRSAFFKTMDRVRNDKAKSKDHKTLTDNYIKIPTTTLDTADAIATCQIDYMGANFSASTFAFSQQVDGGIHSEFINVQMTIERTDYPKHTIHTPKRPATKHTQTATRTLLNQVTDKRKRLTKQQILRNTVARRMINVFHKKDSTESIKVEVPNNPDILKSIPHDTQHKFSESRDSKEIEVTSDSDDQILVIDEDVQTTCPTTKSYIPK